MLDMVLDFSCFNFPSYSAKILGLTFLNNFLSVPARSRPSPPDGSAAARVSGKGTSAGAEGVES